MPDIPSPNANDRLQRLGRLTLKELREILRDRRTIVTLVLMPLFMYPLMSVAFQQFFVSQLRTSQTPRYAVGFQNEREGAYFEHILAQGGLTLVKPRAQPEFREGERPAAIVEAGTLPSLEKGLQENEIDVGLRVADPATARVHDDSRHDLAVDLELLYLPKSATSRDAAAFLEKYLAAASERFLELRLGHLGITQRPMPIRTVRRAIDGSNSATGSVSIAAIIPFILILMTVTGAVYPAIDLTAGERERGTLEVLIAAPIPRVGVLLAKYVAVLSVALLTAAANLLAMTITIAVSGLSPMLFGNSGISTGVMAAVFGLLLLFAAFFSAVLLVITSTARSFKEAQAYLIPLMLVSLVPGILGLMPDVELTGALLVTPLANIVLLGRDLLHFRATGAATVIVVASTLLYAAAAIGLAARIFGGESVLYSTHSGWSDLFRRPREPQRAPSMTAAVVGMALMFPAYFLFFNLLGQVGDDIVTQLFLGVVMTVVVFGGIPLAACRLRRIPVRPAFCLPHSPWLVLFAVALIGLSLWTLCHETVLLLRGPDVSLDPKLVEKLMDYARNLRSIPVPLILLALAVTPAFFEEAVFRGFFFAALRSRTTPTTTIVSTAIAFGFFHWISPSLLASERFVSSTLVGLVLGWVRWRTDSLLPGIVLHALHNALLILVAYYEQQLSEAHFGISETEHLPGAWLAAGAIFVCVGLAALQAVTRKTSNVE